MHVCVCLAVANVSQALLLSIYQKTCYLMAAIWANFLSYNLPRAQPTKPPPTDSRSAKQTDQSHVQQRQTCLLLLVVAGKCKMPSRHRAPPTNAQATLTMLLYPVHLPTFRWYQQRVRLSLQARLSTCECSSGSLYHSVFMVVFLALFSV